MKRKIFAVVCTLFILITLLVSSVDAEVIVRSCSKIINKYFGKMVRICEPDEISKEMLLNRKGKYIVIEVCIGKVLNKQKDGKILNTSHNSNYICYQRVKKAKVGDKIMTVFVYADNKYIDDYAIRIDKIIKRK